MDKKLEKMRKAYQNNENLRFTKSDKEEVFDKIARHNEPPQKAPLFPWKVVMSMLAVILIGAVIFASADGDFFNTAEAPTTDDEPSNEEDPSIEGYVMEMDEDRILVVEPELSDNDQYQAVWYSDVPDGIEMGQFVYVWHEGQEESYPAQASIDEIEIQESETVDESNLTEQEALNTALSSTDFEDTEVLVVDSVSFDSDSSIWEISLNDSEGTSVSTIQVDDEKNTVVEEEEESFFDYEPYGKPFTKLEIDVVEAMQDSENILNQLSGDATLNAVAIDEKGTVTMDFEPFEESITSGEKGELTQTIAELAFAYDESEEVYVQFEGSSEAFRDYMEAEAVTPITRDNLESNQGPPEPDLEEVLTEYEEKVNNFLEGQADDQRITTHDSIEEIRNDFMTVMSRSQAQYLIETYVREDNGLYLVATGGPVFINLEEPYSTEQVSEKEYQVIQEKDGQMRNGIFTFNIVYNGEAYVVDSIEHEETQ
ncbi:hypothetical protein CEY16_10040 [Halalkalibacillus sediminis]|uniref:Uncharacterized protein n=1 Tax=Halalkalibacillus sediminis TaxID=2018042 RepID=A0A2I0QRX4_9BACI|nr:DUF3221 domain-containing protein [Halalkalibacillus sediminis]PKR77078.1 hypothetical protein CEY16_10040 [Halalkalibacillus sediminis]